MRRTTVVSTELNSSCVEAISAQIVTHFGFPLRVARGLLHDNPFWRHCSGDTSHLWPQRFAAALSMDSCTNAGSLAGGSANNDICAARYAGECSNVVMDGHPRESLLNERAS